MKDSNSVPVMSTKRQDEPPEPPSNNDAGVPCPIGGRADAGGIDSLCYHGQCGGVGYRRYYRLLLLASSPSLSPWLALHRTFPHTRSTDTLPRSGCVSWGCYSAPIAVLYLDVDGGPGRPFDTDFADLIVHGSRTDKRD